MIGGTSLFSIFSALPDGQPLTTAAAAKAYVRALCDNGVAVLVLHPGTKEPVDLRTPQAKNKDDKAAREAARVAGRADWERVKAPRGLHLASTDKKILDRYIDRFFKVHGEDPTKPVAINLAIEVGRSNLVVVDCDTAEQVAEFLAMCGWPANQPPTVRSPGKLADDGVTWLHSNGGHFYFTVDPAHPLPFELGSTVIGRTGIAVLWHDRYVLIPPSVRKEGAYRTQGRDYPLLPPLREMIEGRAVARRERILAARVKNEESGLGNRVDAWARMVSWTDLLAPEGWVPVGRPDTCGCPILTAPGGHSNPKSATAHEVGCTLGMWDSDVNAPLHIWTDNPGEPWAGWIAEKGTSSITKFQAVSLLHFDGNGARAMDGLGLSPSTVTVEGIDPKGIGADVVDPRNMDDAMPTPPRSAPPTAPAPPMYPLPGAVPLIPPGQQLAATPVPCSWCGEVHAGGPENCQANQAAQPNPAPCPNCGSTVPGGHYKDCPVNQMSPGQQEAIWQEQAASAPTVLDYMTPEQRAVALHTMPADPGNPLREPGTSPYVEQVPQPATISAPITSPVIEFPAAPPPAPTTVQDVEQMASAMGVPMPTPIIVMPQPAGVDAGGVIAAAGPIPTSTSTPLPEMTVEQQDAVAAVLGGVQAVQPEPPIMVPPAGMSLTQLAGGQVPTADDDDDEEFPAVGQTDPTSGLYIPINSGVPEMAPFRYWRDMPATEFLVEGLVQYGGLASMIGAPDVGKSTLALDLAAHICTGRNWHGRRVLKTKVLYLAGEGVPGVVARMRAWEQSRDMLLDDDDFVLGNGIIQLGASKESWAEIRDYISQQGFGFIVFDTLARMAAALDENSAQDMGRAVHQFDRVRNLTGCTVLVVHHTGKVDPAVGRGSSALKGALDSELLINASTERTNWVHPITNAQRHGWLMDVKVTKQKNAEKPDEDISLMRVDWNGEAPLITGPNGEIDPMQGDILIARPVPEALIDTAVRIREYIDRFPAQGLTRTDIAAGVIPDPFTADLRDPVRRWRLKVAEAVDRSLGWQLLQTPPGSSARYVPGPTTVEEARQRATAEVMAPNGERI